MVFLLKCGMFCIDIWHQAILWNFGTWLWHFFLNLNYAFTARSICISWWASSTRPYSDYEDIYSRELEVVDIGFSPRKTVVAAMLGLLCLRWKKMHFANALDQNIQEVMMKLDFHCLMRQKWRHIAKGVVLFHPHHRGPAGLPTWFCAGWKSTVNDLCSRLNMPRVRHTVQRKENKNRRRCSVASRVDSTPPQIAAGCA